MEIIIKLKEKEEKVFTTRYTSFDTIAEKWVVQGEEGRGGRRETNLIKEI